MALATVPVTAQAAAPPNRWLALAPLPEKPAGPVFALAVSPSDSQLLLAGTSEGSIYRSADGGASWKATKAKLGRGVLTLAFNPFRPTAVYAGTRGFGIWRSGDAGESWQLQPGTETRTARSFGFTRNLVAAATEQGLLLNREGGPWAAAGPPTVDFAAVVATAIGEPARLVAGGDASRGAEPLPLYSSADSGQNWTPMAAAAGSSMVAALAAGPAVQGSERKPLVMGTNSGAFLSSDAGGTWLPLTGGGTLPATNFTAAGFVTTHAERFYVASDGGASERGGLWSTTDGGGHFLSLQAPVPAVTALSLSSEEVPTLYVATFRPADQLVTLWSYRDGGGAPQAPATGLPPVASAKTTSAKNPPRPARNWLVALAGGPEAPYLLLGAAAVLTLLVALIAYLRGARRLR